MLELFPGGWDSQVHGAVVEESRLQRANPIPKNQLQAGDDDDSEGGREAEGNGRMLGWNGIHSRARVVVAGVSAQTKYRKHLPPQFLASEVRKNATEQSLSWHC